MSEAKVSFDDVQFYLKFWSFSGIWYIAQTRGESSQGAPSHSPSMNMSIDMSKVCIFLTSYHDTTTIYTDRKNYGRVKFGTEADPESLQDARYSMHARAIEREKNRVPVPP